MKYKLNERTEINPYIWHEDNEKFLLYNNGIDNVEEYLDWHKEYDCSLLMNISKGYDMYYEAMKSYKNVGLLVDSDGDGATSASTMYRYSKLAFPNNEPLVPLVREGKQHGLSQEVYDFCAIKNIGLLVVPDAQCDNDWVKRIITELNCNILVLDHHETDDIYDKDIKNSDKFVVINPNQIGDEYPNKALSGCAVAYKFIKYCDSMLKFNYTNRFIPMVALSLLSDSMDMSSYENKHFVEYGLPYISEHPLIAELIKKQTFSLKGKVEDLSPMDVSFYIIPLINAVVRIGTLEECERLFKAFCEEYEEFEYSKRGSTEITLESIYECCARMCVNAKSRQGRIRDKDLEYVNSIVRLNRLDENKLIVVDAQGLINTSLTGLTAMKVAEKNRTPILIVNNYHDDILSGSGRNFNNSYIEDLKGFLNESGLVEMAEGHKEAFGIQIKKENISKLVEYANNTLANIDTHIAQNVDLIIDFSELDMLLFKELEKSKQYVANNINSLVYLVQNIPLNLANANVMGKNKDNWKCVTDYDNITCLNFSVTDDKIVEHINDMDNDIIFIDAIGKLSMGISNGLITPQIIIDDYEIVQGSVSNINNKKEAESEDWDNLWED